MVTILYELPQPSSVGEFGFEERAGHTCALKCIWEDYETQRLDIVFLEAIIYKCTYGDACVGDMIRAAYSKLVEIHQSPLLADLAKVLEKHDYPNNYRHLMIYVDDGPCYEVLCQDFRIDHLETPTGEPHPLFSSLR